MPRTVEKDEIHHMAEALLENCADEDALEEFLAVIKAACRLDRDFAEELYDVVDRSLNEH